MEVFVGIRKGDSFAVSGDQMTNGNVENVFAILLHKRSFRQQIKILHLPGRWLLHKLVVFCQQLGNTFAQHFYAYRLRSRLEN